MGESFIFLVAVLALSAEYYRQSKKNSAEVAAVEDRWNVVDKRIEELEFLAEKQRVEIRELTRMVYAQAPSKVNVTSKDSNTPSKK